MVELYADFQQYYGLDLAALLDAWEWRRADMLARGLPRESRTLRSLDPRLEWGEAEYLLAAIADNIAFLRYESAASSGAKRVRKPKPVKRPGKRGRKRSQDRTVRGMSKSRVAEILSRPRT